MKLLAILDQHEAGLFEASDREISYHRQASRAVLRNEQNQIAVMYFHRTGSSKLPGGGIDEGETPIVALKRELLEETGYEVADIEELGIVKEYRYVVGMEQTAYCYMARVTQYVGTALTDKEAAEGMELRWYDSYDEAIAAIEQSDVIENGRTSTELTMMKLRESTILRAAQTSLDQS